MALADAYATFDEYRAHTGLRSDGDQDTYEALLVTASRMIERWTERVFNQSAAGVARYFDGNGRAEMYIDDLATLTAVDLDTTGDGSYAVSVDPAAVLLRPRNAAELGEPYTSVELVPARGAPLSAWPSRPAAVRITGTWGYAAVPGAIRDATILIARQLRDLQQSGLTLTVEVADQQLQVRPGSFSLIAALREQYSRRLPGIAS